MAKDNFKGNWLLGGGFNDILNVTDKSGDSIVNLYKDAFQNGHIPK